MTSKYMMEKTAAVGRNVSPATSAYLSLVLVALVPIEAILGHIAFDRILQGNTILSVALASLVALVLAVVTHLGGKAFAQRKWAIGIAATAGWAVTVSAMAAVRYLYGGMDSTRTGDALSSTTTEGAASGETDTALGSLLLMLAVFTLTGVISAILGALHAPRTKAREKALHHHAVMIEEVARLEAAHSRALVLHAELEDRLARIPDETSRALRAQRSLTREVQQRAALALREKGGNPEWDFHNLVDLKDAAPNPEVKRLLNHEPGAVSSSRDGEKS